MELSNIISKTVSNDNSSNNNNNNDSNNNTHDNDTICIKSKNGIGDPQDKIILIDDIESIKQDSNWDCGVACISSVLKWSNKENYQFGIINEIINTKSIWSIDLSNALTQLQVPHIYYTNSIGVRNDYSENKYYKDNWESDTLRVNQLFFKSLNTAPCNLVLIGSEKQLPIQQFIEHISKKLPIILLVDSNFLNCSKCNTKNDIYDDNNNNNHISTKLNSGDYLNEIRDNVANNENDNTNNIDNNNIYNKTNNTNKMNDDSFFGHYIVLVGYNYETKEIIYIDPSSNQLYCTISEQDLDNARMKPGTDLDCIFITNEK
ncbi:hypothetical protein DICPUDRAFT_146833 [Dictyostelium purpureum]|uniref:Guanylyl cyclase n=1 Tax=Dictyostelium purpureum TaxID=5786 RepID=F0Z707_DICPU|nr:uncharacterized protein DICPUDRAFT_146833 [Dictyostelium purpureum]EGC40294.1 hypothetical protein DICPUDRAFT_146833 [Dictyostelium purpureum]|eukprot:XP_003283230.1 hypothetical protein DICPUDRAFT_146833 [Dictyostelium purpureum]